MFDAFCDVVRWMRKIGQDVPERCDFVGSDPAETGTLYCKLIDEEYQEFVNAKTRAEQVDGALDLIWVTLGWLASVGFSAHWGWLEVKRANYQKLGGPKCEQTGKQLKPSGWKEPDIDGVIETGVIGKNVY